MRILLPIITVLLLSAIFIESRVWHHRMESERAAIEQAEQDHVRTRDFLYAVDAFMDDTRTHAAEIYGCQNGMRESDKYIWLRWKRVEAEITALRDRADLREYLKAAANRQSAYRLVQTGNELLYEAEQAGGPIRRTPPDWMTALPEWQVTAEDIRNEHFYAATPDP